jgi:hypothetical protein
MAPVVEESSAAAIPSWLAALLWDYETSALDLDRHQSAVIARVLSRGDWRSVCWLRTRYGDAPVREWLLSKRGRSLDRRSVRLWQLVFDLPAAEVESWLAAPERAVWDRRTQP